MDYKQKYLKYKNKYIIAKNNKLFGRYNIDQQYKGGVKNKNLEEYEKDKIITKKSTNLLGGVGSGEEIMDLPNITIDGINFRLVGYNLKNETIDREALKIISTLPNGKTHELYLYQSETSLGFWRLGCYNRGQLYKGENDYIQQTFLHFTLQEFINKNISVVKCIPFVNTHPELNEINKEQMKKEYPELLNNSFPFCYNKMPKYKYTFELDIPQHIIDPSRMINIEPFIVYDKDSSNLCGNWKKNPQLYLENISNKLSEQYQLDKDNIKFLYNDVYEYNNKGFDGINIKLNVIYKIYLCKLISKNDESELFLYYTIYSIKNEDRLIVCKNYFPLFLTTNLNITPFGTFQNYVLSAGYICKIFEYRKQADTFGHSISKEHLHIGFMYNNLFPFNEIKKL